MESYYDTHVPCTQSVVSQLRKDRHGSVAALPFGNNHLRQFTGITCNCTHPNYALRAYLRQMLPAVALRKAEIGDCLGKCALNLISVSNLSFQKRNQGS